MQDIIQKVEALDISLFDSITSETSYDDRTALLAIHRATARIHSEFSYLEIGSHLGGTIQPYLLDPRCRKIFSIDSRPLQQMDDRQPGCIFTYEGNSTDRMLSLLKELHEDGMSKIQTFEMDASEVPAETITPRPNVAFIDGEHTYNAAISDFLFCSQIINPDGAILFHDFQIIYPAILHIIKSLKYQHKKFSLVWIGGQVIGIFLDKNLLITDPYLSNFFKRRKNYWFCFRLKFGFISILPNSWVDILLTLKNKLYPKKLIGH